MRSLLASLLLPLCGLSQFSELREAWKADNDLKGATIAYCVMNARSGQVLEEMNSTVSMVPASTLKIFTTGAALSLLGTDFRYETRLVHTGTFDANTGIIYGDLIISGSGDPTLQSEYFGSEVMKQWAEALSAKGVKEVRGRVIGDASAWERTVPDHWIWSDISNYFGASPCGLSYKDNKFQIGFNGGKTGSAASITTISPQYKSRRIILTASVVCEGTEDKAFVYGDPLSYERLVSGSIPAGRSRFEISATLPDPALLCAEELSDALKAGGIPCGEAISTYSVIAEKKQLLHSHYSPALHKIVEQTNLQSNNHYCESLLLTLGRGSRNAGIAAVRDHWKRKGLEIEGLFLADGSGLSRASTCNARLQCQALLTLSRDSSLNKPFKKSLPVSGKQGSMSSVGKGTVLENNLRAKTGYIQRVRAYCGYITTKKGEELIFSILFNHYNCSPKDARLKIEKFLLLLPDL